MGLKRFYKTTGFFYIYKVVWGYLVSCVFVFCLFFVFLYGYGFLSGGKGWGVKFCEHVGLLSGQVSHLGELWLVGSHDGSITFGM